MSEDRKLYNEQYLQIMAEFDSLPGMSCNRIELIKDLAVGMNYKTIGLANCVMFTRETKVIKTYLEKEFNVYSVNCKHGRLKRAELLANGDASIICNPAGQAEFLTSKKCDLNISIGLCVGHDMIFNDQSKAPVTTLFTKDFTNNNNPAKAVNDINQRS